MVAVHSRIKDRARSARVEDNVALKGVDGHSAAVVGFAPKVTKTNRWRLGHAIKNHLAAGAACLGILAGTVGPVAAQSVATDAVAGVHLSATEASSQGPIPIQITGIPGDGRWSTASGSRTATRFQGDTEFASLRVEGDGPVDRAFLKPFVSEIPGGARIDVVTRHMMKDDQVDLHLFMEVLDKDANELRTIYLAELPTPDVINPDSYTGGASYSLSYDDVNSFLTRHNPNLQLVPGETSFAVYGVWKGGHTAGGFGRGGAFRLPGVSQDSSAGTASAGGATNDTPLPLDMEVPFSPELAQAVPQFEGDGGISSRLESEAKFVPTSQEALDSATRKMYEAWLASERGDRAALEALFGQGWSIETSQTWWLKDDPSIPNQPGKAGSGVFAGYRVGDNQLPLKDPMVDDYMDDDHLRMTQQRGAFRLRSNKGGVKINIKPGGCQFGDVLKAIDIFQNEVDIPGICQRIEWGYEMAPGTTQTRVAEALKTLAGDAWANTVFNLPQQQLTRVGSAVILSEAGDPWALVTQQRHKFSMERESDGLQIEFSFDTVKVTTLRPEHANPDGTPRETELFILETELNHLGTLGSKNQAGTAAGPSAGGAFFSTNKAQEDWLSGTSSNVTTAIDPRLHEISDLQNEGFRSTKSYLSFEDKLREVIPKLFPGGVSSGMQKAAAAAERFGLVVFDDAKLVPAVENLVGRLGYRSNAALQRELENFAADPDNRAKLEDALAGRGQSRLDVFLQESIGNEGRTLEIDVPAMTTRVRGRLSQLGYVPTGEVDAIVAQLAAKNVTVAQLEGILANMGSVDDAEVLKGIADAAGVRSMPKLERDPSKLFGENTMFGGILRRQLARAHIAPASAQQVETFLSDVAANCDVELREVRDLINHLSQNPEQKLSQLKEASCSPPALHPTRDYVADKARPYATAQYVAINKDLMGFFDDVAERMNRTEIDTWINTSFGDLHQAIHDKAEVLGIDAPDLAFNFVKIHAQVKSSVEQARVSYTPELQTFVEAMINQGVDLSTLRSGLPQLRGESSLRKVLEDAGVDVTGVSIPQIQYDSAAVAKDIEGNAALRPYLDASKAGALDAFVTKALAAGLSASQTSAWAEAALTKTASEAMASANIDPARRDALPILDVDVATIVEGWATQFSSEWKSKHADYARQALQTVLESDDQHLSSIWSGAADDSESVGALLVALQALSGQARTHGGAVDWLGHKVGLWD